VNPKRAAKAAPLLLLVLALGSSALPVADPVRTAVSPGGLPPIVVGVSNVQSGPSRFLGQELIQGARAYLDRINAEGGVHGRRVTLVVRDDGYEPVLAVRNTRELIERDRVLFLFGYVGTPTLVRVLPLLRYYARQDVVNVAPFTGADPPRRPPYDRYVFNVRASYREEARALVRHLHSHGHRRIGFLGQADAYGKSVEIGVRDALSELGLDLVESVTYRRNQHVATDMSAQVRLLRQARAEAVIVVGGPSSVFIRTARLAGWDAPIANVSFVGAEAMLAALREASGDVGLDLTRGLVNSQVVPSPEDPRYPLTAEYRSFVAPEKRGFVGFEGWLDAVVVVEALRRAGPAPTRAGFIRALESLTGWDPGLGAPIQFSPTYHKGLNRVWLTRTENGRWVPDEETGP
jgi:ABC-type branched-subunit amino acid transport system substrate-binding protein